MAFWKHRNNKETRNEPVGGQDGAPAAVDASLDQSLDALALVLRTCADYPIELAEKSIAEIGEELRGWARHVLLATPPPGAPEHMSGTGRNWTELERFFRAMRQTESEHVVKSLEDLRHIIRLFIQTLGNASEMDTTTDARALDQLAKLQAAIRGKDTELLRKEAVTSANLVASQIEMRRARHQDQVAKLSEEIDQISTALVIEKKRGEIDGLTGVYCRAALDERLADLCKMGQVIRPSATLFMMDVDHFKWVNDEYGHGVGDDVLRRIAARLRQEFRRKGDFLARYGGDEFVAIIDGEASADAREIGERALFAVRDAEVSHEGKEVRVSISMGIAALEQGQTPAEWLESTDKALYVSKKTGRDRLTAKSAK